MKRHSAQTRVGRLALFAGLAAVGLFGSLTAEEPATEPEAPVPAAIIPVSGIIDETLVASVSRRADEAAAAGNRIVIFHITSDGGYLDAGLDLSRALERLAREGVRTIAYVDSRAYSAAAIAAVSCQEIVMSPEASLGACTPYAAVPLAGPQPLEPEVRAKLEGAIIERMQSLAEKHGYPPAILKAMVKMSTTVIDIENKKTHEHRTIEEEDLFQYGTEWEKRDVVVPPDEVLTVGSEQAKRYGLARHIIGRLDDLYDLYPIRGRIAVYPVTWSETLVAWLNNMWLKALLVLVGLLGLYVEMNTPGFGVPGTIGLVAFGILFLASFLAGQPDWLPLLLFVAGLAMLLVELFVTPGFGILGGGGILLILGALVLALPSFEGLPERDFEYTELFEAIGVMGLVLAAFGLCAFFLARFLPHVPVLGRVVLAPSGVSDGSSHAAAAPQEARVGDVGRAVTKLHPAGKARFADRLLDVIAEGDFLDADRPIRVVEVRGNRIVVRPSEPHGPEEGTPA
ncbi:MAG: NfeD family protein [Phycisphaerae bacterium]|nr:NfeD family protein [Phycisphaerae bacterium]